MEEKKYQVFVSSTYRDLIDAREKVIETVLNLYHFSADDSEQWEIIKEMINFSDYYIVIIGHKYGSVTAEGVSYTEKEYDYAKEKGIPIMAFVRNREAATSPKNRESAPKLIKKLDIEKDDFVQKATANKLCDFWDNIDDLATKVAIALPKMFARTPQVGWIRGSEAVSKEMSSELAELSNENRELRQKVRDLKSKLSNDCPILELNVAPADVFKLQIDSKLSEWEPSAPNALTKEDVPSHLLYSYVSDDDLQKYNSNIPSLDKVSEYCIELKAYLSAQNKHAKHPSIDLKNTGTAKANDVTATIEFPDIVSVTYHNAEALPKSPLPANPIKAAEKKYKEDQAYTSNKLGMMSIDVPRPIEFPYLKANMHSINDDLLKNMKGRVFEIKNNTIKLYLKTLMHTCDYVFENEFTITPIREGESEIKIRVICEEMREPLVFAIPIEVEAVELNG